MLRVSQSLVTVDKFLKYKMTSMSDIRFTLVVYGFPNLNLGFSHPQQKHIAFLGLRQFEK